MALFEGIPDDSVIEIKECLQLPISTNVSFSRIGSGEGFLGSLWRGEYTDDKDPGKTKSFIAKTVPPLPPNMPDQVFEFLENVQPHKRECGLYTLLGFKRDNDASQLSSSESSCGATPYCLGITAGQANGDNVFILLEDLSHSYRVPSFVNGLTLSELKEALEALARFHAATKSAVSLATDAEKGVFFKWKADPIKNEAMHAFADALKGRLSESANNYLRNAAANDLARLCCDSVASSSFDCVIHGDFWSSNVMLCDTPGKTKLIDFQFCCFGAPEVDVIVMLCTSVSAELRRMHLASLIQTYNDSYQKICGQSDGVLNARKLELALPHALYMIVLSYETWTENFNAEILLGRFAAVVEDVAAEKNRLGSFWGLS